MNRNWASTVVKIQVCVAVAIVIILGSFFFWSFVAQKGTLGAIRDVGMAEYAHLQAGPPIPVNPKAVDYSEAYPLMPGTTWGMQSNSQWLTDIVRRIVPYFYYVGISRPAIYPLAIIFEPMTDAANFHLLGQTSIGQDSYGYVGPIVELNERMIIGDATDQRVLLATIVHEMIHGQQGNFINPAHCAEPKDPNKPTSQEIACWVDESPALESNTQTATLEVLAAYCNHQNELACKTFWLEVEDASSSSFQVWAWDHKLSWLYDWIDKTFWLTPGQVPQYDASMRYWQTNCPECLKSIVSKYGKMVWDKTLLGVRDGQEMPTGLADFSKDPVSTAVANGVTTNYYSQCEMTFADERYQLGWPLIEFLRILSWDGR